MTALQYRMRQLLHQNFQRSLSKSCKGVGVTRNFLGGNPQICHSEGTPETRRVAVSSRIAGFWMENKVGVCLFRFWCSANLGFLGATTPISGQQGKSPSKNATSKASTYGRLRLPCLYICCPGRYMSIYVTAVCVSVRSVLVRTCCGGYVRVAACQRMS